MLVWGLVARPAPAEAGSRAVAAPAPVPAAPVSLSVAPPWPDGAAAPGQTLPLRIRVDAGGRFSDSVRLRVARASVLRQETAVTELVEELDLPAGAEWEQWLVLPAGPTRDRLEAEAGPASAAVDLFIPPAREVPRPIALVLSPSGSGWEFLGSLRPAEHRPGGAGGPGGDAFAVVYVRDPGGVPPWFAAYRGVGLVVLAADFPADRLSQEQLDALAAYLRGGGRVAIPADPPLSWGPAVRALEGNPPPGEAAPAGGHGPRPVRLEPADPAAYRADPARLGARLGLEAASPPPGGDLRPGAVVPAEDALRSRLLSALWEAPVEMPPRWAGGAALAYATWAWAWARRFRRSRGSRWGAAGLGAVAVASAAGAWGGLVLLERADRPRAVLLVRPAWLTGQAIDGVAPVAAPPQAELLVALPGLRRMPWELRPAQGAPPLLPAPLSPGEVAPGTGGVRLRRLPGGAPRVHAWRVEPLPAPAASEGPGAARPGGVPPGGWVASFYVDAPLPDLAAFVPPGSRAVVVSAAGVAAGSAGDVALMGSSAAVRGRAAQELGRAESTGLHPGPAVLANLAVEALAGPEADGPSLAVIRETAAALGLAAASGSEVHGASYLVALFAARTSRPVVEARRPGGRWFPVATCAVVVSAAELEGQASGLAAGAGPAVSGAGEGFP